MNHDTARKMDYNASAYACEGIVILFKHTQ